VAGSFAYVADGTSGLQIINVSDPASPFVAGVADTPGPVEPFENLTGGGEGTLQPWMSTFRAGGRFRNQAALRSSMMGR
jgi:hypothetical protein